MVHVVFSFFLILCFFSFFGQTLLDIILCDGHDKGFPFLFVDFNYSVDQLSFPLFHFPLKISFTAHFFLTFTYVIIFAGFQLSQNSHF
jgi:hypothetical protein